MRLKPTEFVFSINQSAKLVLAMGDLTRWKGDAIVNAANEIMLGGGGVDGAIHRAAGPKLKQECEGIKPVYGRVRCPTGEARITSAYNLPVKYVLHTVGPIYSGPSSAALLEAAYRNSLELANEYDLKRIAFPAISCGIYGYPTKDAAQVSLKAVQDNIGNLQEVHFLFFDKSAMDEFVCSASNSFISECQKATGEDNSGTNKGSNEIMDGFGESNIPATEALMENPLEKMTLQQPNASSTGELSDKNRELLENSPSRESEKANEDSLLNPHSDISNEPTYHEDTTGPETETSREQGQKRKKAHKPPIQHLEEANEPQSVCANPVKLQGQEIVKSLDASTTRNPEGSMPNDNEHRDEQAKRGRICFCLSFGILSSLIRGHPHGE